MKSVGSHGRQRAVSPSRREYTFPSLIGIRKSYNLNCSSYTSMHRLVFVNTLCNNSFYFYILLCKNRNAIKGMSGLKVLQIYTILHIRLIQTAGPSWISPPTQHLSSGCFSLTVYTAQLFSSVCF